MTTRFRPQLFALEARDVPASFSFQLPDGTTGHGTFATPAGVDATQASQSLAVADLTVVVDGVEHIVQPGATANYAYGELVGVTAAASVSVGVPGAPPADPVELSNGTVQVGGYTAPVAYDATNTYFTFLLSNGVGGAISFEFDWNQVDPDLASQALSPTAFNLNIAGQNYEYGSANYTTPPTILFANGDLVGVSFWVNTPGSPFLSVSVGNGTATAIDAITGLPITAPVAAAGSGSITLDFSTVAIPATGIKVYKLQIYTKDGNVKEIAVEISAGATAEDVRNGFKTALAGQGIIVEAVGTTRLTIQGSAQSGLKKIFADGFGTGRPKLVIRTQDADGTFPTYE